MYVDLSDIYPIYFEQLLSYQTRSTRLSSRHQFNIDVFSWNNQVTRVSVVWALVRIYDWRGVCWVPAIPNL